MTFEQKVMKKIEDIIQKRGISQKNFADSLNDRDKLNSIEFLALCKILKLNSEDFNECFAE